METALEEYKTLREEIGRSQGDILKIMEFGIGAVATLLAFAYSEFITIDRRWLYLFIPEVVIFPVILLIAQRTYSADRIGRYIQNFLEPKLSLNWERVNFEIHGRRKGERYVPFVWSASLAFLIIQLICHMLSLLESPKGTQIWVWGVLTIIVAFAMLFEISVIRNAHNLGRLNDQFEKLKDLSSVPKRNRAG